MLLPGGTFEEVFPLGAATSWVLHQESKALVLEGGRAQSEGPLRYERAFARRGEVPFQVACLVHDEPAHAGLHVDRVSFESR